MLWTESPVNDPLPKYNNPPVVEVALSVQFERLDLSTAHLGLVWEQFRNRFPVIQEKPELDTLHERFDPPGRRTPGVRFEVGSMPMPRFWFVNESGNELVQVQRDRFIRNWRKTENQPAYPSYDKLRTAFVDDWELFSKFVTAESKSVLVPDQCEVTYVNIIEDVDSSQLSSIIAWIRGTCSDDYLGNPEDTELTLRYVMKDDTESPWGRLHVTATPAICTADGKPVVRLILTARGAPHPQDTNGVLGLLDKGHEAIVRGFTSITTGEMHKKWERKA